MQTVGAPDAALDVPTLRGIGPVIGEEEVERFARWRHDRGNPYPWSEALPGVKEMALSDAQRDLHEMECYRKFTDKLEAEMAEPSRNRCNLCGRKLVHAEDAYGPGDPRIDCGGDCLACMWSVEEDAGETRAPRPDEFQLGMDWMHDDRAWLGNMGENPHPVFVLSASEVRLLTGQGITDPKQSMKEMLVLDERMRRWLAAAEAGKIA